MNLIHKTQAKVQSSGHLAFLSNGFMKRKCILCNREFFLNSDSGNQVTPTVKPGAYPEAIRNLEHDFSRIQVYNRPKVETGTKRHISGQISDANQTREDVFIKSIREAFKNSIAGHEPGKLDRTIQKRQIHDFASRWNNLGPGETLPPKARSQFEKSFGYDLSNIRLHKGSNAS